MNNLEKEFIPYEQALALKELGFNEPCFGFYGGLNVLGDRYSWDTSGHNHNSDIGDSKNFHCTKLLYQQAFRWFREKYGWLQIIIGDGLNGNLNGYGYSILEEGWINFYDSLDESVIYDTYEEAELACLIKLIEIVKK